VRPAELLNLVEAAEPNRCSGRSTALCELRAWDDLVALAVQCREAHGAGKTACADRRARRIYRAASEGPARLCPRCCTRPPGGSRGTPDRVGRLDDTFDEPAPPPHAASTAGVVAAERVLAGEDLRRPTEATPRSWTCRCGWSRGAPVHPGDLTSTSVESATARAPPPFTGGPGAAGRGRPKRRARGGPLASWRVDLGLDARERWRSPKAGRGHRFLGAGVSAGGPGADSSWIGELDARAAMACWLGGSRGRRPRPQARSRRRTVGGLVGGGRPYRSRLPPDRRARRSLASCDGTAGSPSSSPGWHLHLASSPPPTGGRRHRRRGSSRRSLRGRCRGAAPEVRLRGPLPGHASGRRFRTQRSSDRSAVGRGARAAPAFRSGAGPRPRLRRSPPRHGVRARDPRLHDAQEGRPELVVFDDLARRPWPPVKGGELGRWRLEEVDV